MRLAGLFDKPRTSPLDSNPFAIVPPALSHPAPSSVSADGHAMMPHLGKDHTSPPKSFRPNANSHIARSPQRQILFASCPAPSIAQTRRSIWREAPLPPRPSVDESDRPSRFLAQHSYTESFTDRLRSEAPGSHAPTLEDFRYYRRRHQ